MTCRQAAWVAVAALLTAVALAAAPQQNASAERQLEAAIHREQVLGDVKGAIEQYKTLAQSGNRSVAAQALIHLGHCYEKLGEAQAKQARAAYERVVRDYADQAESWRRRGQGWRPSAAPAARGPRDAPRSRRCLRRRRGLTADGKYVRRLEWAGGDVIQFDLARGQTSRITNKGPRVERGYFVEGWAFSRDGKRVAFDR